MVLHVEWQWLFVAGTVSIPAALLVLRLVPPDPDRSVSFDGHPGESRVGIGAIFQGGLARTTFLATLVSVVNLAGYWGAAFWIPTFLTKERGLSPTTMAGFSFVMYLGMFLGFQFFGMLTDRIGRRRAMIAAFVTVAAAVAVYIVVQHPMFLFWWGIVVGFGLCGSGGVLRVYYAKLFPERVRAYAGGFCWNMGRVGAVLVPCNIISFVFKESMINWRQLNQGGRHVAKISSNINEGGAQGSRDHDTPRKDARQEIYPCPCVTAV